MREPIQSFALPIFGRLVWRYSTVNDGVTRFKGILKFSEARRPGCKKSGKSSDTIQAFKSVLHRLGGRKGQLLRSGDLDFLTISRITALASSKPSL